MSKLQIPNAKYQMPNRGYRVPSIRLGHLRFVICVLLFAIFLVGCETATTDGPIIASGFIEGEEVVVAPQASGRIAEMLVDRGDDVRAGDVLVRLDDSLLLSQQLEAEAGLVTANANLDHVLAGSRPQEIEAARAAIDQVEAQRDGATQAVINAQDVLSNPLLLDVEITAARTQARLAEQSVEMAEATLAEMELRRSVYVDQGGDVERTWNLQLQASQHALAQAEAELWGNWQYLEALQSVRDNPLTLRAQLHGAEMQLNLVEAHVAAAQAALDDLEAGATEEEIAMAEAQVHQAEAAVRLFDTQIAQLTLEAPMDGVVTSRSSQVGETATAGLPLLTIANMDEVTLVIYIPETRVGHLRLGQEVQVQVDSFPGRAFIGEVVHIAGEAEFTPRNVQTQEERVNLVFAVKVRIPNPERALKPGMPADATIRY